MLAGRRYAFGVGFLQSLLVAMLLTLVACEPTPSPTSSPTTGTALLETCIPTPSVPAIPSPTPPPPSPTPKVIWFLLDRSRSMNTFCDGNQRVILQQLPAFFLSLGGMAAQECPASSEIPLSFGLEWFGPHRLVLTPTLASRLLPHVNTWSDTPEEENADTNEYAEALRAVREAESPDREQAVVLLTDGTYVVTTTSGVESIQWEEQQVLDELSRLRSGTTIYVVLCNNDEEQRRRALRFWEQHTHQVYDMEKEDVKDWLPRLTRDLMEGFLPGSAEMRDWLSDSEREIAVPGNVSSITANVVAVSYAGANPRFAWREEDREISFQQGMWPLSFRYSSPGVVAPNPECEPHQFIITPYGEGVGFYWVELKEPDISVSPVSEAEPPTSENEGPVAFEVSLESTDIPLSSLMDRARCYQVRLQDKEGGAFRGDSDFGNDLRAQWVWQPARLNRPREVSARVVLTSCGRVMGSWPLSLWVKFRPWSVEKTVQAQKGAGEDVTEEQGRFFLNFSFEFVPDESVPDQPLLEVFLHTAKEDDLNGINQDRIYWREVGQDQYGNNFYCPPPDQDREGEREIPDDDPSKMRRGEPAVIRRMDTGRYQLVVYRFLVTKCGYNTIIFEWDDSGSTIATVITWTCEVLDNGERISCSTQ